MALFERVYQLVLFQTFTRNMGKECELFDLYKQYPDGGKIWLMQGVDSSSSDYDDILAIAICLATEGHEVKILRPVHYKDPIYREVFGELIGTEYYRKCPDLLIDDYFVEYESYTTDQAKNAFRNMLHNGLSQSNNIILRQCNLSDGYMIRKIQSKLLEGATISSVCLFDGKRVRQLYKTEG